VDSWGIGSRVSSRAPQRPQAAPSWRRSSLSPERDAQPWWKRCRKPAFHAMHPATTDQIRPAFSLARATAIIAPGWVSPSKCVTSRRPAHTDSPAAASTIVCTSLSGRTARRLGSFWMPLNANAAHRVIISSDQRARSDPRALPTASLRHRVAWLRRRAIGPTTSTHTQYLPGSARTLTDQLGPSWSV